MSPARTLALVAVLAAAIVAAGCGGARDSSTPVACLNGPGAYLHALADAPGPVVLAADTPISSCLAENQDAGDLAAVGTSLVGAATTLNSEARQDPGGKANLELGYLVGAAEEGAEGTEGIHADLIRRLTAAATYSPGGESQPATFLETYREGIASGKAHG